MSIEDLVSTLKSKRLEKTRQKEGFVREEQENWKVRASVYKALLERYADVISLQEQKTIPELKQLITPGDEVVQSLRSDLLASIGVDELSEHEQGEFIDKASVFIHSLPPAGSELSFNFWLKPKEIIETKAADAMDKAILLCSLFSSVNLHARVRILELSSALRQPVVLVSLSNRVVLLDCSGKKKPSYGLDVDSVVSSYDFEGAKAIKSLYEFDSENYEDFET
ncbi:MAG: hypothetical protein ABH803_01530 [Candidatus Micrarchaeota archaeon]